MRRELNRDQTGLLEDWQSSNIAIACPVCLKVFIVSGMIHRNDRGMPELWQVEGVRQLRWKVRIGRVQRALNPTVEGRMRIGKSLSSSHFLPDQSNAY